MVEVSELQEESRYSLVTNYDYTVVEKDPDGNVCVEINIWNLSKKDHDVVKLCLVPKEALLLANMLIRHADGAEATAT